MRRTKKRTTKSNNNNTNTMAIAWITPILLTSKTDILYLRNRFNGVYYYLMQYGVINDMPVPLLSYMFCSFVSTFHAIYCKTVWKRAKYYTLNSTIIDFIVFHLYKHKRKLQSFNSKAIDMHDFVRIRCRLFFVHFVSHWDWLHVQVEEWISDCVE